MSLENQVLICYFNRTHLFKGEALNGVGAAGRGGGGVGGLGAACEVSMSTNCGHDSMV